ncbi:MAG: carbohydrate kinase family protein [Lentisphaeria bacterium]|nr:PfkB family carbohydrate kinase [Lentisphaeria bacterium]NQZ71267.1 carbohydrate kinase family protein [Lentisphaeria bacterium]
MDILCVGYAVYDLIFSADEFPLENTKYQVESFIESGGGPAANAAYLLSKWHVDCGFSGAIGDDHYGQQIINEFTAVGTDIRALEVYPGESSSVSMVWVNTETGTRTIINSRRKLEPKNLISIASEDPKIILFDGHIPKASIEAMELFPNALTILDAGSVREGTVLLADKVDYLLVSERFAKDFCESAMESETDLREALEKLQSLNGKHVAITLGERGLVYWDNGFHWMQAEDVKSIDSTGAGDIFHGAFAYGLLNNYRFTDNLKFSSKVAAISSTRKGARDSIPSLDELIDKKDGSA